MKKFLCASLLLFTLPFSVSANSSLTEEKITAIAEQFVNFHKTEAVELLQKILAPDVNVTVTQGSNGYGFVLNYNRQEYIDYLQKGHKSKFRIGTDVTYVSSEFLGNREAKFIVRYRSKQLNKYVWVEGIVRVVGKDVQITEIEEYT
ncbi:hypothetical protein [Thalassotalea mangrovi]|uniref:Nuclear transport factor 2 family protein n=1 Tax=Thalassotalea mangrovi TaxID=2572245 RepID=A0A4U1B3Y1_9GAMM|nr:hypothetical protein [Thalassotalea mangrovi]TKB44544.1 hypothetical protein E8M12_11695 [Thalassotalea mangrovi]